MKAVLRLLLLLAAAAPTLRPVVGFAPRLAKPSKTLLPQHVSRDRATRRSLQNLSGLQASVADQKWPFWFVLPLAPYSTRKTLMEEVVSGQLWTFDQLQGTLYVLVPVRMTVAKLADGGLLVYAPVAPTAEVIRMVRQLEVEHGPVRHVVLPTLGLEHVYAGPFARRFPKAELWATPQQYSFPLNLPLAWLGFGFRRVKDIPAANEDAPWRESFDHATLGPLISKDGIGAFGETAFYHRATKTLLVTDVVVKVRPELPQILLEDKRALLFHARDDALQLVPDMPATRAKGWRHIQQFALFFQPGAIDVQPFGEAFEVAKSSPMKELGWGGLFPFVWRRDDAPSFRAMQGGLLVAPILQTLILNREASRVLAWVDEVSRWGFKRLVPCHLANDVATDGREFRRAFGFLRRGGAGGAGASSGGGIFEGLFMGGGARQASPLEADLAFLRDAEKSLVKAGTIAPADVGVAAGPGL